MDERLTNGTVHNDSNDSVDSNLEDLVQACKSLTLHQSQTANRFREKHKELTRPFPATDDATRPDLGRNLATLSSAIADLVEADVNLAKDLLNLSDKILQLRAEFKPRRSRRTGENYVNGIRLRTSSDASSSLGSYSDISVDGPDWSPITDRRYRNGVMMTQPQECSRLFIGHSQLLNGYRQTMGSERSSYTNLSKSSVYSSCQEDENLLSRDKTSWNTALRSPFTAEQSRPMEDAGAAFDGNHLGRSMAEDSGTEEQVNSGNLFVRSSSSLLDEVAGLLRTRKSWMEDEMTTSGDTIKCLSLEGSINCI